MKESSKSRQIPSLAIRSGRAGCTASMKWNFCGKNSAQKCQNKDFSLQNGVYSGDLEVEKSGKSWKERMKKMDLS
uniref:Uncharacterized protein n=1 Tax=Arundo donax TaxID=35708 RepID=A0A0A9GH79_ARUDO